MRVAMYMPILKGRTRFDQVYWTETTKSLAQGLSERGVDISIANEQSSLVSTRTPTDQCLLASAFFEGARDFDLIHGYFSPLFATYAGMTKTPVLMTLDSAIDASQLRVFKRYNERIFYVSFSDGTRHPQLSYVASISPGIETGATGFCGNPDSYLLCPAQGLTKNEIAAVAGIAERSGRKLLVTGDSKARGRYEAAVFGLKGLNAGYVEPSSTGEEDNLVERAFALLCGGHLTHFPHLFLKAIASGTPIIAMAGSSVADLVLPGVTGFVASSPDQAVSMLFRVGDMDRMGCRVQAAEQFSMNRMVESYLSTYSTILTRTAREDHRPWGYYEVLSDEENYKVKRIVVYPGKRLSLQRHSHRAEHWHIISGHALVRCGGNEIPLQGGASIDIPEKCLHRIQNPGTDNLMFIEVQRGDYCGEDDIERFEDDYGRA